MSRIIHGTLFVPSYQPTGNPGEWTITNAIYTNVSDDTGIGAYAIQTGFILYVPAANINTQLPVPGVVHRYKITSHTIIDASTLNCTILWDEGGSEVDIPHNGDYAIISEVGTGQGLAFPVSNQIYPLMKAGMDIAAIAVEEKVKIDKITGGGGGGSYIFSDNGIVVDDGEIYGNSAYVNESKTLTQVRLSASYNIGNTFISITSGASTENIVFNIQGSFVTQTIAISLPVLAGNVLYCLVTSVTGDCQDLTIEIL